MLSDIIQRSHQHFIISYAIYFGIVTYISKLPFGRNV